MTVEGQVRKLTGDSVLRADFVPLERCMLKVDLSRTLKDVHRGVKFYWERTYILQMGERNRHCL